MDNLLPPFTSPNSTPTPTPFTKPILVNNPELNQIPPPNGMLSHLHIPPGEENGDNADRLNTLKHQLFLAEQTKKKIEYHLNLLFSIYGKPGSSK